MKFLLDENVHHGLIKILHRMGHSVKLSPKTLSNGQVLSLAISERRILITHDTDFSKRIFPQDHPGIILVEIPSKYLETLKTSIGKLLAEKAFPSDFRNKLMVLTERGFEEYPFAFQTFKL